MQFDKLFAERYINALLKRYKIKVHGWSATSSGHATYKTRSIKIPKPTNVDRFAVCLHEICHILDGKSGKSFQKEFACDMYARKVLVVLKWDVTEWDRRTKWHVLSRIAMAHNRGLNHAKISAEIRSFFREIDFAHWIGNKVFVGHAYYKSNNPADIEFTPTMNKEDIVMYLGRKGLMLDKSQTDDSTYGKWRVTSNGDSYGETFDNLPAIVKRYQLNLI